MTTGRRRRSAASSPRPPPAPGIPSRSRSIRARTTRSTVRTPCGTSRRASIRACPAGAAPPRAAIPRPGPTASSKWRRSSGGTWPWYPPGLRRSADMSIKGKAYIAGVFEHPTRKADTQSLAQLHAESAMGALADAGLTKDDVDGYFCAGDAPGLGPLSMADYMGLKLRHMDSTETGGSSYVIHVGHAAQAIALGPCNVALITLAGPPPAEGGPPRARPRAPLAAPPAPPVERPAGPTVANQYAMAAMRHMYQYGTTSAQLAWIKVAASQHAQHNPRALLREVVTVEEVINSPMISDPLHRLDCCVITDGGGAIVVAKPEVAKSLKRPLVKVLGAGEAPKHQMGGKIDLTYSGAVWAGPTAFAEAGVTHADIKYVSIYDSFTITVLITLEDLGVCPKGQGGKLVADGNLISGVGKLPFNTDGGGLCNNHPANRGGLTKVVEAGRQLRGEAHPKSHVTSW